MKAIRAGKSLQVIQQPGGALCHVVEVIIVSRVVAAAGAAVIY